MALAGKKSGNMHNLSGSKKSKLQAKFDEDFHDAVVLDPDSNPILASILYTLQNVTEDIDHLRTYAGSELKGLVNSNTAKITFPGIGTTPSKCKAGNTTTISNTQANAITANTNKVGFVTTMPTTTDGHTVSLSVTNSKGSYALVFTMVDSTGKTAVTKTATIALK